MFASAKAEGLGSSDAYHNLGTVKAYGCLRGLTGDDFIFHMTVVTN